MAFAELKKADSAIQSRDSRIFEPELELATLKSAREARESELGKALDAEKTRADKAEKESGELKAEMARVREELFEKEEEKIIAKFEASPVYDQAMANVGAPKIQRC